MFHVHILLVILSIGHCCKICSFGPWSSWTSCSTACGGGTKSRQRAVCCPKDMNYASCVKNRCFYTQKDIWYGTGCNRICHHGDFVNNSCTCLSGWEGPCCEKACAPGYYGDRCLFNCTCLNGKCDHITGKCSCFPGWKGSKCEETCAHGFYGNNCSNRCSCKNGDCDHVTGECSCFPGWQGSKCNAACDKDHYGVQCTNVCSCYHGSCSHVNGSCFCFTNWTGEFCNTTSQVSGRHDGNMFSPAWYIYLLIPAASCLVVGLIISFFRFGLPKNTQSQSSRIISPLPTTIQYDEIADFENNVDVVQGLPREQSQYDKLCGTRTEAAYHEFSNVPGISKYSPCNYKQDMVVDKDNTLSQTVKLNVANHYEDVK